ncbi:hypothetical protein HDV01_006686 [Terramyces sp. JEL0728]|nr:hypothetical protein HDV01_006686 [Terramyces sp. JEL0728]
MYTIFLSDLALNIASYALVSFDVTLMASSIVTSYTLFEIFKLTSRWKRIIFLSVLFLINVGMELPIFIYGYPTLNFGSDFYAIAAPLRSAWRGLMLIFDLIPPTIIFLIIIRQFSIKHSHFEAQEHGGLYRYNYRLISIMALQLLTGVFYIFSYTCNFKVVRTDRQFLAFTGIGQSILLWHELLLILMYQTLTSTTKELISPKSTPQGTKKLRMLLDAATSKDTAKSVDKTEAMEAEQASEQPSDQPQESAPMAEPNQSEQTPHLEQNASSEETPIASAPPKEPIKEIKKKSARKGKSSLPIAYSKHHSEKKEKDDNSESFQAIDPLKKVEEPNLAPSIAETHKIIEDPYPYRHYFTYHPCVNKLLDMKWDKTLRTMHLKKLQAVKSNVDNKAPKPFPHLSYKLKKIQMENDRQADIYRNNRILLERMSAIMYLEAHDPEIHQTKYPQICKKGAVRAKEQTRISIENKKLLQRLETKQPHYNHTELDIDRYHNLQYLQNISSFPQKYLEQRQEYVQKLNKKPKVPPINGVLRKTFLNTVATKHARKVERKVLPGIRPRASNVVEKHMMDSLSDASATPVLQQVEPDVTVVRA